MENPFKAIKTVALAVLGSREDSTPYTQVLDFEDIDPKKLDLSPEAMKELLAGRNDADAYQKSFERVAAKKSQTVVQPKDRAARAAQYQIPSQYRTVRSTRTSIVKGETSKPDKDDMEPEITFGPKY